MSQERVLLFVGAHPDDESFGVGGTLARYAAQGVRTYYACATRGEVGSADPEHLEGFTTPGDMRWAELECAAQVLGLAGLRYLGFRDSGMTGSPDNEHPESLASAPPELVTGRVIQVIRELRPQVLITFDPIGGYRHPDHIAIHNATVRAFSLAGDPAQYPEAGPAYAPQKLYYHVFPKQLFKLAVRALPLIGQDPRRFGRNKDIDLTGLVEPEFPVHARIDTSGPAAEAAGRASACHASQLGGGPPRRGLMRLVSRLVRPVDHYMRAQPPVSGPLQETDLFAGVS